MKVFRPRRPSWRVPEPRAVRPGLWLLAAIVVGMMLVEVWAGSRVAQLSLALGQNRTALEKAQPRLAYLRADLERRTTRAEAVPLAPRLGLAPADAEQVVVLPSMFLAADPATERDGRNASLLVWAERASRALVPEATARVRTED